MESQSRKATRRRTPKPGIFRVQLVAEAVAVICPKCGEAQPNHEGSEMWIAEDFAHIKRGAVYECVSCEARLLIAPDPKAQFDVSAVPALRDRRLRL